MIRKMLVWLFPPKCVLCGGILREEETDFCGKCRRDIPTCPVDHRKKRPFLDSWLGVWYYEGPVRRSLLRYKFRGARSYANAYGRVLAMRVQQEHPEGFDLLTWVPISSRRKSQRGYDQVEILAKVVAAELEIEAVPLLKKIRHNKPQSGISGDAERRANVLGVYCVTQPELVEGKKILLLDDIITTGATVSECARMLLTAGAKEIHCGAVGIARREQQSR